MPLRAECAWESPGIRTDRNGPRDVVNGVAGRELRSGRDVSVVAGLFKVVRLSVDIADEKKEEGEEVVVDCSNSE